MREIVHSTLSTQIDNDPVTGLMAFYEMVIGDTIHAEEIYARLAAAQEPSGVLGEVNLYRRGELLWGMLGAVNLAYLHKRNGQNRAVEELLRKAREYIESESFVPLHVGTIPYVRAQIATVEGNNDAAIEYFRKAVDGGWSRAWFGRIDPIMADLRKDARYIRILEELEDKLLKMGERATVLASN